MVRSRRRSIDLAARWGFVIAAAVMLLAWAPAALAAPKTTHAAAYEVMKTWMQRYDQDGFAQMVDVGSVKRYRARLARARIVVDSSLRAIATYDPNTNTITFSKDPRKVKNADRDALGETVWHEVTHALEDQNGDDFTNPDKLYQDRNTWYMTHVAKNALSVLDQMERRAKAGDSVQQLRAYWTKYLKEMEAAGKLPETLKYPPDLDLMKRWFGFRANPAEIKALYLSGKALPGKQGANLRKALALPPQSWDGEWATDTVFGAVNLTQSGSSVAGVFAWAADNETVRLEGTLGANGMTLTGRIVAGVATASDQQFTVAMRPDWLAFKGTRWFAARPDLPMSFEGQRK